MKDDQSFLFEILNSDSAERRESLRVFLEYCPKIGLLQFMKIVFSPIKFLFKTPPILEKADVVFDCSNAEKFKRMRPLVKSLDQVLLFVSDLSTERSKIFFLSKDVRYRLGFPANFSGYWRMLPRLLNGTRTQICFRVLAAQHLIHYDWIFKATGAKFIVTANDDSWISPILSKFCKMNDVVNINVMHGRTYQTKQFYDYSIVFGRESERATSRNALSTTKVLRHTPVELFPGIQQDHFHLSKKLIFFDQPNFEFFSQSLRNELFSLFDVLHTQYGFDISIKLHPAQQAYQVGLYSKFHFFKMESNQELLAKNGIALSICSTVGLEVISSGLPIIYVNQGNVLEHFLQINFLKNTAPTSVPSVLKLLLQLQEGGHYHRYYEEQLEMLKSEYMTTEQTNPLIMEPQNEN